MMRRLLVLLAALIVVLMTSPRSILAQTPLPPAWPPDPAALFADGVEIIEAKEIPPAVPKSTPQPSTTKCGQLRLTPDAEVALIHKNEQYFICELATGKLSQPITHKIDSFVPEGIDGEVLALSPDKRWTSFITYQKGRDDRLWAYERSTQKFIHLGRIPFWESYYRVVGWASNTELYLMTRDMPEWSNTFAYVATVPIENSLREAMMSYRFWIAYYDDPPRFEMENTPGNVDQYWYDHEITIDCTRSVYDFASQITTTYHYGSLCMPEYSAENGAEYFRDVQKDGKTWLVRFNVKTRERQNLYYGEIERLHWVSEDERYALLSLDSSGKTECIPGFEWTGVPTDHCWDVEHPMITLVDLATGQALVSNLGSTNTTINYGNYVTAIDDHTIVVDYSTDYGQSVTAFYLRVEDGQADLQVLDGYFFKYLDDQRLILQLDASWEHSQYMVYDPVTLTKRLITKQTDVYYLYLAAVEGDTATITVSSTRGYSHEPPAPQMQYIVKLPS